MADWSEQRWSDDKLVKNVRSFEPLTDRHGEPAIVVGTTDTDRCTWLDCAGFGIPLDPASDHMIRYRIPGEFGVKIIEISAKSLRADRP